MKEIVMNVVLKGKTRHGKNRIHQHGDVWVVEGRGQFRGQPALSLRSMWTTFMGSTFDRRWVLEKNDENFDWKVVE
tara:strand:- start:346 stop:573 length:228 start_codon:yes stop_codon:yes gene_type:complete